MKNRNIKILVLICLGLIFSIGILLINTNQDNQKQEVQKFNTDLSFEKQPHPFWSSDTWKNYVIKTYYGGGE